MGTWGLTRNVNGEGLTIKESGDQPINLGLGRQSGEYLHPFDWLDLVEEQTGSIDHMRERGTDVAVTLVVLLPAPRPFELPDLILVSQGCKV